MVFGCVVAGVAAEVPPPKPGAMNVEPRVLSEGYDRTTCWVHARGGLVKPDGAVITLQKLTLAGNDVFDTIHAMRSDDAGKTWSAPQAQTALSRRKLENGQERCPSDATPAWHEKTGKLLLTGHTAVYDAVPDGRSTKPAARYRPRVAYSVYDEKAGQFGELKYVDFPPDSPLYNSSAGCTQRFDLPDGTILLPVYTRKDLKTPHRDTVVLHCSFDGETLNVLASGKPLSLHVDRGLVEPSVTGFGGQFFLTLRNDQKGYVSVSPDGLDYSEPKPWRWEDGEEIGNYNTQQHWMVGGGKLYLVYTRRAGTNDHVFRHRAPLFAAQVDPEKLCLVRATEVVVVPERGSRLGNFGVTHVSDSESWVIVTEWMQSNGGKDSWKKCEQHGGNNRIWLSRITW